MEEAVVPHELKSLANCLGREGCTKVREPFGSIYLVRTREYLNLLIQGGFCLKGQVDVGICNLTFSKATDFKVVDARGFVDLVGNYGCRAVASSAVSNQQSSSSMTERETNFFGKRDISIVNRMPQGKASFAHLLFARPLPSVHSGLIS